MFCQDNEILGKNENIQIQNELVSKWKTCMRIRKSFAHLMAFPHTEKFTEPNNFREREMKSEWNRKKWNGDTRVRAVKKQYLKHLVRIFGRFWLYVHCATHKHNMHFDAQNKRNKWNAHLTYAWKGSALSSAETSNYRLTIQQLCVEWASQQTQPTKATTKWKICWQSSNSYRRFMHIYTKNIYIKSTSHRKLHHDLSITSWVYWVVHSDCYC